MAARKRARTGSRKTTTLADAPAKTRKAVLAGIRAVLKRHGVDGQVVQLQVQPKAGPRPRRAAAVRRTPTITAAAARPAVAACPPGTVRRVVCFFRKGTFVCEERCVPA
jgi:hypothetical protein